MKPAQRHPSISPQVKPRALWLHQQLSTRRGGAHRKSHKALRKGASVRLARQNGDD